MTGEALAQWIAQALRGSGSQLPSGPPVQAWAVALPSGRHVVLIRDFGWSLTASLPDRAWHPKDDAEARVAATEIAQAALAWQRAHPDRVTALHVAADLCAFLSQQTGCSWTLRIPGVPVPTELWLGSSASGGASVGVFQRSAASVLLSLGEKLVGIHDPPSLEAARAKVLAAVRRQLETYEKNLRSAARVRELAAELASGLAARIRPPEGEWQVAGLHLVTHERGLQPWAAVYWGTRQAQREVLRLVYANGAVRVHAGLAGARGYDGELRDVASALEGITAAVEQFLSVLTAGRLEPGCTYRVIQEFLGLEPGTLVRFAQHYSGDRDEVSGYMFETSSGQWVTLPEGHRIVDEIDLYLELL